MTPLNVCYFGTPEFAVPPLLRLLGHPACRLRAVVTQQDRPAGRGLKLHVSPVKQAALERGLPCLQPADVNAPEFLASLRGLAPDVCVVVAFGQKFGPEILALPAHGCINAHASLLPRHRGASPIQSCLMQGDAQTGVTVMFMNDRMDAGDILLALPHAVGPEETAGSLTQALALLSAEALAQALDRLAHEGGLRGVPQDETLKTYTRKITAETGRIDWARPAVQIHNLVRALSPHPGAFTRLRWRDRDRTLKILLTRPDPRTGPPGSVLQADKAGLRVAAGEGSLWLDRVQIDSGKPLSGPQFLCGYPIEPGTRFFSNSLPEP